MRKLLFILLGLLAAIGLQAQQKSVTGTVISKTTGQPLSGASVTVKNKTVLTDSNGHFSIPFFSRE